MTQMDYKYSLLRAPPDDFGQGPVLLHMDDMPVSLFAVLEVKRGDVVAWHRNALGFLNKLKVCSFMCFLTVSFLVAASYMLLADKKGLLLTPPPYRFGSLVNPGLGAFNLSASRDLAHIRLVVKSIVSRVEFHSGRRVPERKALVSSEPHMFSVIPRKFLPGVKNPCWYEEYTGNITSDPYEKNQYERFSKRFHALFEFLRNSFREHLFHRDGKLYRTRCLPYFYIIGQPKCGTTDLYDRLRMHPDVRFSISKEPHWWTRKRFGIVRLKDGFHERFPVDDYLDLFDLSAFQIQDQLSANVSRAADLPDPQRHIIIGEASASTMWDNKAWMYYSDNTTDEPPYLNQDFIHALHPDTRLIVIFRDPVERLYSDYLYFGETNKSAEDFHDKVSESLQLFDGCVAMTTIRSCVYNSTLNKGMPIRMPVGLYVVFLLDWLTVFPRDQLLVLRLEDHALNRKYTMNRVFNFLSLGPLTEQQEAEITQSPASNTRTESNRNLGPMLAVTRELLQDFYQPFNQKLAQVLQNNSFLWDSQ
ncbi:Carbohydrate sulfotransferase 15 [Merluccius polli]|uniref:Sulfotransferase n=1 Tax=Merluccius polli TaxID=89951 RepID=A0AA47ML79_MERPO|nr:Carbohydrate sulfotransferase 15 [Merluccius polli]